MRLHTFLLFFILLFLFGWGCSPKIYEPPRAGAEYIFEDGYFDKKPRPLFDPKAEEEMREKGILRKYEVEKDKPALPKKQAEKNEGENGGE